MEGSVCVWEKTRVLYDYRFDEHWAEAECGTIASQSKEEEKIRKIIRRKPRSGWEMVQWHRE